MDIKIFDTKEKLQYDRNNAIQFLQKWQKDMLFIMQDVNTLPSGDQIGPPISCIRPIENSPQYKDLPNYKDLLNSYGTPTNVLQYFIHQVKGQLDVVDNITQKLIGKKYRGCNVFAIEESPELNAEHLLAKAEILLIAMSVYPVYRDLAKIIESMGRESKDSKEYQSMQEKMDFLMTKIRDAKYKALEVVSKLEQILPVVVVGVDISKQHMCDIDCIFLEKARSILKDVVKKVLNQDVDSFIQDNLEPKKSDINFKLN